MCNGKRKRPATDEDDDVSDRSRRSSGESAVAFFTAGLQAPMPKASELLLESTAADGADGGLYRPEEDRRRPDRGVATDAEKQTSRRAKKPRVARSRPAAAVAEAKPEAKPVARPEAKQAAKPEAKPAAAKPAVRHATAKPEAAAAKPAATAKPAEKPAAGTAAPTPKPAKPKAAAKPKNEAKPAS